MTHYYFDLKDGTRLRDHTGTKFETDADAVAYAHTVAKDVASERSTTTELFVSIIDNSGREVAQVPVPKGGPTPDVSLKITV